MPSGPKDMLLVICQIWEDAYANGLVDSAPGMSGVVSLTEKGRRVLSSQGHA
jgi:hypothetical protein